MRLRQIALVAQDLESTVADLGSELGADVCFRDPGVGFFGLENALLALGDTFLEVVSPNREGTTAGRYLDRRGGDGGYMVLLQLDADERTSCRQRAVELGIREVHEAEDTHGTDHIVGTHFHPGDTGGAILSVDTSTPASSWGWAGDRWSEVVRTERAGAIVGADIQSEQPEALAARWGQLLGLEPDHGRLTTEQSELRFVAPIDDRGDGLCAIEVVSFEPSLSGSTSRIGGIDICWRGA
ncbi:MAG: hypothetical protein GY773_10915 [Actinomycetia bacterium]|nr:hypothetical protein [Actinomycetes bacterium]